MKKIIAILAIVGFVGLLSYRIVQSKNSAKKTTTETAEKVFPVKTAVVELSDVPHVILLTGNLKPKSEVDISSKIGGRVERVIADLGDRVRSGAPLAIVEHREISLQVKQAEAGLSAARVGYKNAKDEYNRGQKVKEAGAMSDSQLDGLRARMESAEAQFAQADASVGLVREALRNATISAPIAGVVTRRSVDVGQMVGPGIPVYQVQESSVMKFTAGVEAGDFVSLKKGMPVAVFVEAFPNEPFEGVIARISPALDPYTRRANVEIEIKNKSGKLLANMFARGVLEIGKESNVMAVPTTAILQDGAVQVMYRVEGEKAVRLPIEAGFKTDRITVIRTGAKVGDAIVITGQNQLSDGARVIVEQ